VSHDAGHARASSPSGRSRVPGLSAGPD